MNHISNLPSSARERLNNLVQKRGIIIHLNGEDDDTVFLMDVINWIYADTPTFPYKPLHEQI